MSWFNLSDNINLLTIIGAIALVVITVFVVGIYIKRMKDGKADGEISKDSWDDIKEYKNPLPLGWAVMFILVSVWGIWYMFVGYPLNAYSQIGEYNEEVSSYNTNFQNQWSNLDKSTLLTMGESVYLVQCAACHGISGTGIEGKAADLTSWGNEIGAVDSVVSGSKGLMYHDSYTNTYELYLAPMEPMASGTVESVDEIKQAVAYMMTHVSQSGKKVSTPIGNGEDVWNSSCIACHGENGEGAEGVGPDLTKYGTPSFVLDVLRSGKNGHIGDMPNFNDGRLTDIQKEAVATYVASLSE